MVEKTARQSVIEADDAARGTAEDERIAHLIEQLK